MQGNLVTFNGLITGSKLFDIPVYQRSYAWEEDNLKDLWEDLYYLDSSKKHYFGTVMLMDSNRITQVGPTNYKRYDVIDGQQRITTILILLREIFNQFSGFIGERFSAEEITQLETSYLKYQDHYKLNPQGEDGKFFNGFIVDRDPIDESIETLAQRRIADARRFFSLQLEDVKKQNPEGFVDFLLSLKFKIDELQIMEYIVNLNSDAIRMFETVNDRGRPLTNLEKTKSFLMNALYLGTNAGDETIECGLQKINGNFANIYDYIEDVDGVTYWGRMDENNIQRFHFVNYIEWQNWKVDRYMDRIKTIIRNKLRSGRENSAPVSYVLEYAQDLESAYKAVKEIVDTRENVAHPLSDPLQKLFLTGHTANLFPLLIASWLNYRDDTDKMTRILNLMEAFAFRVYRLGWGKSSSWRPYFYERAYLVHQSKASYDDIVRWLKNTGHGCMRNDWFGGYLRSPRFARDLNSRSIRLLLSEYENHLCERTGEQIAFPQLDLLRDGYQVEHIWPSNTGELDLANDEEREVHSTNIHKLGNLTILSQRTNISLGAKPFHVKRKRYAKSRLRIVNELAEYDDWNATAIKEREDRIVAFALKRWSVDDV